MLAFYKTKIRLLVLTDISSLTPGVGEPDDTQSLVRLLLYSNHFDIEGLIATYTEHEKGNVNVGYLEEIVRKYGKVRNSLVRHSKDYPEEKQLLQCIKAGSPYCGMERVGMNMDTEGSDWIIHVVDQADSRSVWIAIWGGAVDLAQALWRVKKERPKPQFQEFTKKIRVYSIMDQYDMAGPWIRENCPEIFYITSYLAFRGMYKGKDTSMVSKRWVDVHLNKGHGPLGNAYPNYDGGDCWGPVKGVKEGDTPSFLYLIPNGLGSPEHPDWGSWGGRFAGKGKQYFDSKNEEGGEMATVHRWVKDYQRSFQARMDWCTKSYEEANHEPVVVIDSPEVINVKYGDTVILSAKESYDPDGDMLSYKWWIYKEAGSYEGELELSGENEEEVTVKIPDGVQSGSVHIILSLSDDGEPVLTSYSRIILNINSL